MQSSMFVTLFWALEFKRGHEIWYNRTFSQALMYFISNKYTIPANILEIVCFLKNLRTMFWLYYTTIKRS